MQQMYPTEVKQGQTIEAAQVEVRLYPELSFVKFRGPFLTGRQFLTALGIVYLMVQSLFGLGSVTTTWLISKLYHRGLTRCLVTFIPGILEV